MRKILFLILLSAVNYSTTIAQLPFHRGVNITNWFQTDGARQIQYTKYTKKDFENIKNLGCDVVRLPINLHAMTSGEPDYIIDPVFYVFLDSVVNWAEELNIYLILDNHTFDPVENTDPEIGQVLNKVWGQMAVHYKNSSEYVLYEVLNEPHGISTEVWGAIQEDVIQTIRTEDDEHYIIVGGSGYNSYNELTNLPEYDDPKLIYTFHFYDPFIFTHQGASWTSPSFVPLSGIPFPYNGETMPKCPDELKGTWVEGSMDYYYHEGTADQVKKLIDVAVSFKNSGNVPVFCGEFGVYMPNSNNNDRVNWYEVVRKYFEEKGIPWTIWDYKDSFGIFEKNSNELFDYDINELLVEKLGLNVPPQSEFILKADSIWFPVYSDFIEPNIYESASGDHLLDYYSDNLANNGRFCIHWRDAQLYNYIGFDLKPNKDLSQLVNENYALDLFIRGTDPSTRFDLWFLDTKESEEDHPWRMRTTVDQNVVPFDSLWHHVHIKLKDFAEQGSWDNGNWYNPGGKFDWSAVDRIQIVAEHEELTGRDLWFDNIILTNLDTAVVREDSPVSALQVRNGTVGDMKIFPNPMKDNVFMLFNTGKPAYFNVSIIDLSGRLIQSELVNCQGNLFDYLWDGRDSTGKKVLPGMYFIKILADDFLYTSKLIKK